MRCAKSGLTHIESTLPPPATLKSPDKRRRKGAAVKEASQYVALDVHQATVVESALPWSVRTSTAGKEPFPTNNRQSSYGSERPSGNSCVDRARRAGSIVMRATVRWRRRRTRAWGWCVALGRRGTSPSKKERRRSGAASIAPVIASTGGRGGHRSTGDVLDRGFGSSMQRIHP
jgi:hypothetical protein